MPVDPVALKSEITNDPLSLGYAALVAKPDDAGVAALLNATTGAGAAPIGVGSITRGALLKACIPFTDQLASGVDTSNAAIPAAVSAKWNFRFTALAGGDDVIQIDTALAGMLAQIVSDKLGSQAQVNAITARTGSRAEALFGAGTAIGAADVAVAIRDLATWKATIAGVANSGGNVTVTVNFVSSTGETISQQIFGDNLSQSYVQNWIATRIASLQSRDAANAALQSLAGATL